jgi:hypothetical protein
MRSTSLFSLFGLALCMSVAVAACSGDDDEAQPGRRTGGLGESCTSTADCSGTNVCIDNVCQKKGTTPGNGGAPSSGGSGGTGGRGGTGGTLPSAGTGGKGGSAGSGTSAPALGMEGESCTKHGDCAEGLGCFNQRCAPTGMSPDGGGEGGAGTYPPPTPVLGKFGETCVLPSDCDVGLTCLPGANAGNLGICTYASSGITPSGSSCTGECMAAEDCCQMPLAILNEVGSKFHSCADLADLLTGTDCADPGSMARECFIQATYCECGKTTWKCTSNRCVYNVACAADGLTTEGCPTYSRGDFPLVSTCNADNQCSSVPPDPTCTKDVDCEGKAVADDALNDTCSPGECTCYKATGYCYRKCSADLDCAANQTCDAKTHVCMDGPECTTDANCQAKYKNVREMCVDGKCSVGCSNDLDCNGGNITSMLTAVCDTDHTCKPIGCTGNEDCKTTAGVQLYCIPDESGAAGGAVHSAVTDGKL